MTGSSKKTSSSTSSAWDLGYAQNTLSNASNLASSLTYDPSTGYKVADLTTPTTTATNAAQTGYGAYSGNIGSALNTAQNVSQGLSTADINKYMSPYVSNVVNSTMAQLGQSQAKQLSDLGASAGSSNALWGGRYQAQLGYTQGQQNLATASTISNLYNQAYNNAVSTAETSNSQALQGAYGLSNIASTGQNLTNNQLSNLYTAGSTLQNQAQNQLTANRLNATTQQMFPVYTTNWLAGLESSLGGLSTSSTGQTKTTTQPSISNYLGAGLGALSSAADGGRMQHFADGGSPFNTSASNPYASSGGFGGSLGSSSAGDSSMWRTPTSAWSNVGATPVAAASQAGASSGSDSGSGSGSSMLSSYNEAKDWSKMGSSAAKSLSKIGDTSSGWGASIVPTSSLEGSGTGSTGGFLSSLGGLFGLAEGGQVENNTPLGHLRQLALRGDMDALRKHVESFADGGDTGETSFQDRMRQRMDELSNKEVLRPLRSAVEQPEPGPWQASFSRNAPVSNAAAKADSEDRPITNAPVGQQQLTGSENFSARQPMFTNAPSVNQVEEAGQRRISAARDAVIQALTPYVQGAGDKVGDFAHGILDSAKEAIATHRPQGAPGGPTQDRNAGLSTGETMARGRAPERATGLPFGGLDTGDLAAGASGLWPQAAADELATWANAKTSDVAQGALERAKSLVPQAHPLTAEEAEAFRKEIAARPGILEKLRSMLPQSLTPEEARTHAAQRAKETGLPTTEDIQRMMAPTPDVNEAVTRQPQTGFMRGAPYGMAASQEPAPPLPERDPRAGQGLAPGQLNPERSLLARLAGAKDDNELRQMYQAFKQGAAPGQAPAAQAGPEPVQTEFGPVTPNMVKTTPAEMPKGAPTQPAEGTAESEPYTVGMPAPKATPEDAGAPPVPMTARLGFEGHLGSVSRDKNGTPSMGRYGFNAVPGEYSSSAYNFYKDHGRELGFKTNPADDPWGFAQEWKQKARENPNGMMRAEDATYNKYYAGAGAAHLTHAGVPKSVWDDARVKEYFGDRLIQHGAGLTNYSNERYQKAWASVKPDEQDKPGAFLKNLTNLDKSNVPYDFRTYLSQQDEDKRADIQKALENRVTNRLKGAMGEGVGSAAMPEKPEGEAQKYKSAAELLPQERAHAGLLQQLLQPLIGFGGQPGQQGPAPGGTTQGWLGLNMSPEQRRNMMFAGLGLMGGSEQGMQAWGNVPGALQAASNLQTAEMERQQMPMKMALEAAKIPKYQSFRSGTDALGNPTYTTRNVHTGQSLEEERAMLGAPGAAMPGAVPGAGAQMTTGQLMENMRGKTGEAAMAAVPQEMQPMLRQAISGEIPLTMIPANMRRSVEILAPMVEPGWSPAQNKRRNDYYTGFVDPKGKIQTAIIGTEAALHHSKNMNDVIENTPDSGVRALTAVGNMVKRQTGNPALESYDAAATAFGRELDRVLTGTTGAASERKDMEERISASKPRQARYAGNAMNVDLMIGKLKAQRDNFMRNIPGKEPPEMLSPESRENIREIFAKEPDAKTKAQRYARYSKDPFTADLVQPPAAAAPATGARPTVTLEGTQAALERARREGRQDLIPAILQRARQAGVQIGAQQ